MIFMYCFFEKNDYDSKEFTAIVDPLIHSRIVYVDWYVLFLVNTDKTQFIFVQTDEDYERRSHNQYYYWQSS